MRLLPVLLLALLPSCGYALGTATGEPVPEPEFRLLRFPGKDLQAWSEPATGPIFVPPGGPLSWKGNRYSPTEDFELLRERFWPLSEMRRDSRLPEPSPSTVRLVLVPDARTPWSRIRPILSAAVDPDIRFSTGVFVGWRESDRSLSELGFGLPRRSTDRNEWTPWNGETPLRTVALTDAARDGIDADALAERVPEGPVLLSAADEVPAQVVADALVAMNLADAGPVLLCPDPPESGGEETLPGVVIR